ncbi:hypothetical protein EC991_008420, partial [Linnemannia zychae]
SNDGTIRVWAPKTGKLVACWKIPRKKHSPIAFSADGQWAAIALKGKIQVTNAVTGESGQVLNNKSEVFYMAFSPNRQWIVTSSIDSILRLWDISSGLLISNFSGHNHVIYTCNFSPGGFQIASGDYECFVRLWEIDTSRAILDLDRPTGYGFSVTYSPDGRSILSHSNGQEVQEWDSRTGVFAPLQLKITANVSSLKLSPNCNQIAIGHGNGTIQVLSLQAEIAERILLGHTQGIHQLAYSPCGRWVVSIGWDGGRLWDLDTNEHPGVIVQPDSTEFITRCVAFTPTGQILLHTAHGALSLYDPRSQTPCTALKTLSLYRFWFGPISLGFSPSGQEVAIGGDNGAVYFWNYMSDNLCIKNKGLKGHDDWVNSMAYSPCGNWILLGSKDMTVRIWRSKDDEVSCWSCVAVVTGFSDFVVSLAWSPVMALEFVTGCKDGTVRVWKIVSYDLASGEDVSVQLLWGNDVGVFCASNLTCTDAIGLNPVHHKLLVQRGAIGGSPPPGGYEMNGEEAHWHDIFVACMAKLQVQDS